MSVYKSVRWKEKIQSAHLDRLNNLEIPFRTIDLQTEFGNTKVTITEKHEQVDKIPTIVLHGVHASAGIALKALQPLAEKYQLFIIDTVGQATMSEDSKLDLNNNSYGKWLKESIEKLGFSKVNIIAASYGGFLLSDLLRTDPNKVNKAIFLVPAGFANGSPWSSIRQVSIPMIKYNLTGNEKDLYKFMSAFYSEIKSDDIEFQKSLLKGVNLDLRRPPLAKENEFSDFNGKVYYMGVEDDIFFPVEQSLKKLKQAFTTLTDSYILQGAKHIPATRHNQDINNKISKWLE